MQSLKQLFIGFLNGFKKAKVQCETIKKEYPIDDSQNQYKEGENHENTDYGSSGRTDYLECEESDVIAYTGLGYYDIKGAFFPYSK
jgi:hypothetical protein